MPQDRRGGFSTELFERHRRSRKALVAAFAEMPVQGVSTRKVEAVTAPGSQRRRRWSARSGALCGHRFSAAAISALNARLDEQLARLARRRLEEGCPYLISDARHERVREAGVIRSQAVLLAFGTRFRTQLASVADGGAARRAALRGRGEISTCGAGGRRRDDALGPDWRRHGSAPAAPVGGER